MGTKRHRRHRGFTAFQLRDGVVYGRWEVFLMGIILLVVLLLVVFGGLPNLGLHSYGYGPSGIGGVLLLVVLVLLLTGRL
jgi:Protein of unknown function (DUF3309)